MKTGRRMLNSCHLTTPEAAARLGISDITMRRWRIEGFGPKYLKIGRSVRYLPEEIDGFLARAVRESTSQGAA